MAAAISSDDAGTTPLYFTEPQTGELGVRRWRISVAGGPDAGKAVRRESGSVTVGSHPDCDLVLSDDSVSRRHLELRLLSEGVLAVDLGSTNGMKVGGVRVDRALVPPNGQVKIGRTTLVLIPDDASVDVGGAATKKFGELVTGSAALEKVFARLAIVARTEATVLIEGESGTGKALLARALHDASPRAGGPFVVVDCAAVDEDAFEAAQGGTIFLDELGALPLELQPKLLRVLEARTVRRAGDMTDRPIDVRFVAATNRDLEAMRKDRTFRDDLYYRVAVVRARIAPLRERPEDIPVLALHFAAKLGGGRVTLAPAALAALGLYEWPGNGRELHNVIERAVALARGHVIGPDELFPEQEATSLSSAESFREAKDRIVGEFEKRYVRSLLGRHQGNVSGAAREAGLSRTALYALMKRVGVEE